MKTIELEDLEIGFEDSEVITKYYSAHLKATRGYTGMVIVLAGRLYELHKERAQIVTKLALYRLMMS